MPRKKIIKTKSLINHKNEIEDNKIDEILINKKLHIVSYWWPNITLGVVTTDSPIPKNEHPKIIQRIIDFYNNKISSKNGTKYM